MGKVQVKKKGGKKEDFDERKLENSMRKSMLDAGMAAERKADEIEKVVQDVFAEAAKAGEVSSARIRETVLERLRVMDKEAAKAWERFDRKYKKR